METFCSIDSNRSGIDASWVNLSADKLDFYLVFELEGPWDRKVEFSENFPPGLNILFQETKNAGKRFKYICVRPDQNYTKEGYTKIIYYNGPKGYFTKLDQIELEVPYSNITEVVDALINQKKNIYQSFLITTSYIRDVFVCGHKVRDACCGKFGSEILADLKNKYGGNQKTRIWESSHMGGHRVGPTIMDMPNGRFWGYLDPDKTNKILEERINHLDFIDNYRGSIGLDRFSQIVEKEIFKEKGWNWFKLAKKSNIMDKNESGTKISIDFINENNQKTSITATVIQSGEIKLAVTDCGKGATLPSFRVEDLVINS